MRFQPWRLAQRSAGIDYPLPTIDRVQLVLLNPCGAPEWGVEPVEQNPAGRQSGTFTEKLGTLLTLIVGEVIS